MLIVFSQRQALFPGLGTPVRIATVALLVILGWGLARTLGTSLGPALFRRLEPGTAGIVGFIVRLSAILAMTSSRCGSPASTPARSRPEARSPP